MSTERKEKLTKEEVAKALEQLGAETNPSVAKIRGKLGKGSNTAVLALRRQLEAEARAAADNPDGLKAFLEVWAQALQQGMKHQAGVTVRAEEDLQAILNENERLLGQAAANEDRVEPLRKEKAQAEAALIMANEWAKEDLRRNTAELLKLNEQSLLAVEQLAQEQSKREGEVSKIRSVLEVMSRKAHKVELENVRLQTLLETRAKTKGRAA